MNAGSDIEYPLIFRRLLVSKVSTLGHLVGYNDAEICNALWTFIQKVTPADAEKLKTEASEIRIELESLLKQEDVKVGLCTFTIWIEILTKVIYFTY